MSSIHRHPDDVSGAFGAATVAIDILAAAHLSPTELARRQGLHLARLIEATEHSSAYYRRKWRGVYSSNGPSPSLQDLPVVRKPDLMRHFSQWVADPEVTLAALHAFTAEPARCGEAFLGRYVVFESSGSSGEPGIFLHDAHALAVYDALEATRRHSPQPWARVLDPLMLSERIAFVTATEGHFASHAAVQRVRRLQPWLTMQWRSFSILQPASALVRQLDAFAPTIVATYPTAAALLADETEAGRLQLNLRELWTGGETLDPPMRERVQRVLKCAVRNSYGASEFPPLAWECGHGRLHVNTDWVILEPVDAQHRPVPAGQFAHTTLLTNLANHVQPLVRYDLGDQIAMPAQACACGSPLPTIEVRGRCDAVLHLRGRDGGIVTVLPLALSTVLENAGIFDFQLRQTAERSLQLRLGRSQTASMAACRSAMNAFAKTYKLLPLDLDIRSGRPLVHGRSGKVQRVIGLPT
jgi:phenylacetate-coenzyme A ligase PaaK-like adenylate-forming protein